MLDKEQIPKVALEEMNEVHYEEVDLLIELLNMLDALADGELPAQALDASLEKLLEHMREHFAGEEDRMVEAAFPPYPVHKAEHDRVLAEARSIYDAWLSDRDEQVLSTYLHRTFPAWMVQHISTMDAVTARFLASRDQRYRSAS